jgi:hypothetical protein
MTFKGKITFLQALTAGCMLFILSLDGYLGARNSKLLERVETGYVPAVEVNRNLEGLLTEAQRTLQDAIAAKEPATISQADDIRIDFINVLNTARENPVVDQGRGDKLQRDFITFIDHAKATSLRLIATDTDLTPGLKEMGDGYKALMMSLLLAGGAAHPAREAAQGRGGEGLTAKGSR